MSLLHMAQRMEMLKEKKHVSDAISCYVYLSFSYIDKYIFEFEFKVVIVTSPQDWIIWEGVLK